MQKLDSTEHLWIVESALHGTRFCRICLESEGDTPLISPCLCRGSAGLCHSACLQTWLRTKETSKPSDLLRCGVCKGRYHVKIAYEEEGNRISNTKDLFKGSRLECFLLAKKLEYHKISWIDGGCQKTSRVRVGRGSNRIDLYSRKGSGANTACIRWESLIWMNLPTDRSTNSGSRYIKLLKRVKNKVARRFFFVQYFKG